MDTPNARTPSVLLYGIEERPPLREAFFAALQHLLAIFIAIVPPPLIIAGALGLDHETTGFLVSMALFASGLSTFIQCRRIRGVGTGLLCIQGTSFSFIGPIISTGMLGGLPLIFGVCIAAAPPVALHPESYYAVGLGYCRHTHRHEPDQSGHHRLRRRDGRP